jgi:hypothetical protein
MKIYIMILLGLGTFGGYRLYDHYLTIKLIEGYYQSPTENLVYCGPHGVPEVSLTSIVANPEYYNGKWVHVVGVPRMRLNQSCHLYFSKADYRERVSPNRIQFYFEKRIYDLGANDVILKKLLVHNGRYVSMVARVKCIQHANGANEIFLVDLAALGSPNSVGDYGGVFKSEKVLREERLQRQRNHALNARVLLFLRGDSTIDDWQKVVNAASLGVIEGNSLDEVPEWANVVIIDEGLYWAVSFHESLNGMYPYNVRSHAEVTQSDDAPESDGAIVVYINKTDLNVVNRPTDVQVLRSPFPNYPLVDRSSGQPNIERVPDESL